jgi:hypothetical protein
VTRGFDQTDPDNAYANYHDADKDSYHDGYAIGMWPQLPGTVVERPRRFQWPVVHVGTNIELPENAYFSVIWGAGASLYLDDTDLRVKLDVITRNPYHGLVSEPWPGELPTEQ